ncbi:MAG: ABC transporter permease [Desulfurococcales archaeon]|nr:ABC transporter permease [Desulfurococcales archaeon]
MIKTILWKELVDLSRDRKTLAAVIILPLLGLPGLALIAGSLASTQQITINIAVVDAKAVGLARELAHMLENYIKGAGYRVNITVTTRPLQPAYYDLQVTIPEGFTDNLTSLDKTARLIVSAGLGTGGDVALQALNNAVATISHQIVVKRIETLSQRAGLSVDPISLLDPIEIARTYHEATGAPASPQQAQAAFTARLLEFAFLFVVNPAVVYMADSVVGERERKTIEKLLLSPVGKLELLAGKMIASFILGFIASLVDALGILVFFRLSGLEVTITTGLALTWSLSAALVILVTSSMVAMVSARSESVRSAQNASFIILAAAMAVYFAALLVDLSRVPTTVSLALQLIPFTHAALAVHTYAIGAPNGPIQHLALLALFLLIFLYLAARSFDSERILLHQ